MKKFFGKLGAFIMGILMFAGYSLCIILGSMVLGHYQLSLELIGIGVLISIVLTALTMWDTLRE